MMACRTELNKQRIKKLKEIIQEKNLGETVEQVLIKFCARNGVSLDTCRRYYELLVESGEISEST